MSSLQLSRHARNQAVVVGVSGLWRHAGRVSIELLREFSALLGLAVALTALLWAASVLGTAPLPGLR